MNDPTVEPKLIDKVDELGQKLDAAIVAVDRETDARVEQTLMLQRKLTSARRSLVLSTVALVVVALVVGWLWFDNRRQEEARLDLLVASCVNTNKARAANQARFEQSGALIYAALGEITPPASQAEADRVAEILGRVTAIYVQKLRDTVPVEAQQRDCSEEAVTTPTLVGTPQPG